MKVSNIENCLRGSLKKRISYSFSLLIAFLISGDIVIGTENTFSKIELEKKIILNRIKIEKEKVINKIEENNQIIEESNEKLLLTMRKADWYSKPIYSSFQVLLNTEINNKTNKNNTKSVMKINNGFGNKVEVGLIKPESLDIEAQIVLVQPKLPIINPNVEVIVNIPNVQLDNLTQNIDISLNKNKKIEVKTPNLLSTPVVSKIDSIDSINGVKPIDINLGEINISIAEPKERKEMDTPNPIFVNSNFLKKNEVKNIITNIPKIPVIDRKIPDYTRYTQTNKPYFWWKEGGGEYYSLGVISNINIESGDININNNVGTSLIGINIENGVGTLPPFEGDIPTGEYPSNLEKIYNSNYVYFHELSEASYSYYGKDVNITLIGENDIKTQGKTLVYWSWDAGTHIINKKIEEMIGLSEENKKTLIEYRSVIMKDLENIPKESAPLKILREQVFINNGNIVLNGKDLNFIQLDDNYTYNKDRSQENATRYFLNEGNIELTGEQSSIFLDTTSRYIITGNKPADTQSITPILLSNKNNIKIMGENNKGMVFNGSGSGAVFFINEGSFNISGSENIGIMMGGRADSLISVEYKINKINNPIEISGDSNIGLLHGNAAKMSEENIFKFIIGDSEVSNRNIGIFLSKHTKEFYIESTNNIVAQIILGNNAKQSIGIVNESKDKVLNLISKDTNNSFLNLIGGNSNIGLYNTTGEVNLTKMDLNDGENNTGIFINDEGKVVVESLSLKNGYNNSAIVVLNNDLSYISTNTEVKVNKISGDNLINSIGIITEGIGAKDDIIEIKDFSININYQEDLENKNINLGAIYSGRNFTKIQVDKNIFNEKRNIDINGGENIGFGLFAKNGGIISAKKNNIRVKKGTYGLISLGKDSFIDITGGKLEYDGEGIAIYSDGVGKIELSDATVMLKGKSTGFVLDLGMPGDLPINFSSKSKIEIGSNDVIVFNLKSIENLNTQNLETTILSAIQNKMDLPPGTNIGDIISNTVDGTVYNKYKIAAVDGGTLSISDLDKSGIANDTVGTAKGDGYFYYNQFLGQKLKATADGVEVKAVLTNDEAKIFENQVIAYEMNSSNSAVSKTDTQINIKNGSIVIADRKSAIENENGGVGLFINYGQVNISADSKIKVETELESEKNTANENGIGIYTVNGSEINNSGKVTVNGNRGIGIYGLSYRFNEEGEIEKNEFGEQSDQGTISINNTGTLNLSGEGTVGIFTNNNSDKIIDSNGDGVLDIADKNKSFVSNTGNISVGNSSSKGTSIGIYGIATIISNTGTIFTGEGGVGIYGSDGSLINSLGEITLKDNGVAVILDNSNLKSGLTLNIGTSETINNGITGIVFKGKSDRTTVISTDIDITLKNNSITNLISLYSENIDLISQGKLEVWKEGVGIYSKGVGLGELDVIGAKNDGEITLNGDNAIGIYADTSKILSNGNLVYNGKNNLINQGTITIKKNNQIGIVGIGENTIVKNLGIIKLEVEGSKGIYLEKNSKIEVGSNHNFIFNANNSIGIYGNGGEIILNETLFKENNNKQNILAYGKDGSKITLVGEVTIDGIASTLDNKRTIGIYLDNDSGINNLFQNKEDLNENGVIDELGVLKVLNGAIGVYSKGNNELELNIEVENDNSIGVYIQNSGLVAGNLILKEGVRDGNIGIYGESGIITIGEDKLNLEIESEKGTGIYLTNGSKLIGSELSFINNSVEKNIAVYYTGKNEIDNVVNINLNGNNSIGIVVDDEMKLSNNGIITTKIGTNQHIGVYVKGKSKYISLNEININDNGGIGIYATNGTIVNQSIISLTGTEYNSATGEKISPIGLAGVSGNGASINIDNQGAINAGNNIGMYLSGTKTVGNNSGEINISKGTGIFVENESSFNGESGVVNVNGTGIGVYLRNTGDSAIKLGQLNLSNGATGVYAEGTKLSNIDMALSKNIIGIIAKGYQNQSGDIKNTEITGNISVGNGSTGIYILDSNVVIDNIYVETGISTQERNSVGLYFSGDYIGKVLGTTINAKDGIGIYLENKKNSSSQIIGGAKLEFTGIITTENGIGIYVDKKTELKGQEINLNINGGIGVYNEGTSSLGVGEILTLNFDDSGTGIGIYNNNGQLELGNKLIITGKGTLIESKNGSVDSSSNMIINDNIGIFGVYDSETTENKHIINNGNIEVTSGGIALATVQGETPIQGGASILLSNKGNILVEGKSDKRSSIGMYSNIGIIDNIEIIDVKDNGIGIYIDSTINNLSLKNNKIMLSGKNNIGIYSKGKITDFVSKSIIGKNSNNSTGIIFEGTTLTPSNSIDIGDIELGNSSIGILVTSTKGNDSSPEIFSNIIIEGSKIEVLSGTEKNYSIGIAVEKESNIILKPGLKIKTGDYGIGIYAKSEANISGIDLSNIDIGTNGVGLYSENGNMVYSGDIILDNNIGIYATGGTISNSLTKSEIVVRNGGVGVYLDKGIINLANTQITVEKGNKEKYSIGIIYENIDNLLSLSSPIQKGSYTIGIKLDNVDSSVLSNDINLSSNENNQIGIVLTNDSNLEITGDININGDKNYGIHSQKSSVNLGSLGNNLSINVGESSYSEGLADSSIGIYLDNGTYNGFADILVGNNSIGIYGKNLKKLSSIGNIEVGELGIGIYASGTGNIEIETGGIIVGKNNSIGVYTIGMDSNILGDLKIGTNTSIGIVSEGNGDINYSGKLVIADKDNTGSVGIYKVNGNGTITTTKTLGGDSWEIGEGGYGIFVKQDKLLKENEIIINNNATMELGISSIGIYSFGTNKILNTGKINVGETKLGYKTDKYGNIIINPETGNPEIDSKKLLNSIGIFLEGGSFAENKGIINVEHMHSIGVYVVGKGTSFINNKEGEILVSNGGTGILVEKEGIAINNGKIILSYNHNQLEKETMGMVVKDSGKIINNGSIQVGSGAGMVISRGGNFENNGSINVDNGVGILGSGILTNTGTIIINDTNGDGILGEATGEIGSGGLEDSVTVGSIVIESNGNITVNGNYISVGGSVVVDKHLNIDGAFVDATTGKPIFTAPSASGEVNVLPNFVATGNGNSWVIEDFIDLSINASTGNKITPIISPLFVSKITEDGDLVVVRRPNADYFVGSQFENLTEGLGLNDLETPLNDRLSQMNEYLSNIYQNQGVEAFEEETGRVMGQLRGDVYATIQSRMENINHSFNSTFNDLEKTENLTKDSNKISLIYSSGNFKDKTIGIDDYNYNIKGLLYMKENEGVEYKSKEAYSLGFTISEFSFDDVKKSEEMVYSLRAGIHKKNNLKENISWMRDLNLTYNFHNTDRKIDLGTQSNSFENKGEFHTFQLGYSNKLKNDIFVDFNKSLSLFANLDLSYGRINKFKEKGELELALDNNDFYSIKPKIGVTGGYKHYLGKGYALKLFGETGYSYELGEVYEANKAKVADGSAGYYSLITPKKEKGNLNFKIGATLEQIESVGVTFEIDGNISENKSDLETRYSFKLNYVF